MESVSIPNSYIQQKHHQPPSNSQQQPSSNIQVPIPPAPSKIEPGTSEPQQLQQQNSYQVKCSLLEYHIQEALLINKAIKSEVKQYRDKIDFEKRLKQFLLDRAGTTSAD